MDAEEEGAIGSDEADIGADGTNVALSEGCCATVPGRFIGFCRSLDSNSFDILLKKVDGAD